jgi:hypothetical protein
MISVDEFTLDVECCEGVIVDCLILSALKIVG